MKNPKLKKNHNIEQINKDLTNILNIIENLNTLDSSEELQINEIEQEIDKINKNLESKYKKFEEENLDSEE